MTDAPVYRKAWITVRRGKNARAGKYRLNWRDDDGKTRSRHYPRQILALRAKDLMERQLNTWTRPPSTRTWADLITEYAQSIATTSVSHNSKVQQVLGDFWQLCRPTHSHLISPAMCELFMAQRAAGEPPRPSRRKADRHEREPKLVRRVPSVATRRTEYQMLSGFFGWATARGYMPANPLQQVRRPPTPRRRRQAPRPSQWVQLLHVLLDRDVYAVDRQAWHLLILLGIVTGYRQAVLLNSYFGIAPYDRRRMTHLQDRHPKGFALVELAGEEDDDLGILFTYSGKTRKEDVFGLPGILNDRLAQRVADLPAGTQQLFPWRSWQRKAWERIAHAAGLPGLTFHTLRAISATTRAIAQAREAARKQLDHASVAVTRASYLDEEQVVRALALEHCLPDLPPLPRYEAPGRSPTRKRLPLGIE